MNGMQEFLGEALALVNVPFTVLFALVVGYWGVVILGGLDVDALNMDSDLDLDVNAEASPSWLQGVARFFHADEGLFMAITSLLIVFMWMASMLLNYHLNPDHSWWRAGLLFIPNVVLSVLATKMIVFPAHRLLRRLSRKEESADVRMIGQLCRVTTLEVTGISGQAEIEREGAPIRVNVRVSEGEGSLKKGDEAVIVLENKENSTFIIKKLEV